MAYFNDFKSIEQTSHVVSKCSENIALLSAESISVVFGSIIVEVSSESLSDEKKVIRRFKKC